MDSMQFAMGWNKYNMWILGVWPEPTKTSRVHRYLSNLVFWSTSIVTVLFVCLPMIAHLFLVPTNLTEVIQNLSVNVPCSFAFGKQLFLRYHEKALTLLVRQILNDWTQSISEAERQEMLKNAKRSRLISIVSSILTYLMLASFTLMSIWSNMYPSEPEFYGLPFPSVFPYNYKKSPNFELTWIGETVSAITTAICYSCFDTFLAVLTLHLCGQLAVLNINLRNLVNTIRHNNFAKFHEKLGFIVHRHNELYRYAMVVEDYFNFTLLVQTLISTSMLCLTGYLLITTINQEGQMESDMPFFIVHVCYTMMHFFIYCYIGEQLLTESLKVAQSAFDCEWYDLPPKMAVSLKIVMMRANVSFQLTAGKFSQFSLELFSTVLKTSASYLSVLLAMNDG